MKCATCRKDKPHDSDHFKLKNGKLCVTCLVCLEAKKKWDIENREKRLITSHIWTQANKDHIKEYQKSYREGLMREHRLSLKKKWRQNNQEKQHATFRKWHTNQLKSNPNYRLARNIRKRFAMAIKKSSKAGSAVKNLGCSIEELKLYLETLWKPEMSWDNYGRRGWHIDHIKPLSAFDLTNPEDLKIACHYTNLQPLWWQENLSKGDT